MFSKNVNTFSRFLGNSLNLKNTEDFYFQMISIPYTKMVLRSASMHQVDSDLDEMGTHFELGDWKLLYILSRNMEPLVFAEFLRELKQALRSTKQHTSPRSGSPEGDKMGGGGFYLAKNSSRRSMEAKEKEKLMA